LKDIFLTAAKYTHSCDVSVVCDIIYTIYASHIGWIIDNMCNQVVHIQVKYFVWRMNCLCVKHIVMRTEKKRVIINGIIIRRTSDIEIESTKLVNLNSTSSVLSFFNYYLHIFNCFNYSIDLDSTAHMLCFYCYWHRCSSRNIVAVDLFQSTQTIFEVKVYHIESNLFASCYIKN
jgi:hypothetical protein